MSRSFTPDDDYVYRHSLGSLNKVVKVSSLKKRFDADQAINRSLKNPVKQPEQKRPD